MPHAIVQTEPPHQQTPRSTTDDDAPFAALRRDLPERGASRRAITDATRRAEPECVTALIEAASQSPEDTAAAQAVAKKLVVALRAKQTGGGVEGLVHEYSLSSEEGVALMCLAEALLRIPDGATRDALIRDKIGGGDWRSHLGQSPSLFVNAATWGLVVTGRLTSTANERSLSTALIKLVARGGEPVIRKGVDLAMRMMGEQFVTGQTIEEALSRARRMERQGFRYSYDMLGEAATTAEDADKYYASYEAAIHAIGKASAGRGIYEGPGISIKLSALHPRYSRSQRDRALTELYPRLKALAVLARSYDIGLNIDAEEADRLELSLDLLELLCRDPAMKGWNGVGFVVQAYGRRAPFVIDWLVELARATRRRLMVRLVKGAYWDSEIKRAQVEGLEDYPVFTRKAHTDVSYLACARKLLDAADATYPQFASHNAMTLAAIHRMAGPNYYPGQYEFQCLHGMGEPLYEEVVGKAKLNRPCRIYAPVGTHETLLAYLVRRLLENGANSSFVNRISDEDVPVEDLVADPVAEVVALHPVGAQHPQISSPRGIFGAERPNSAGVDLADENRLTELAGVFTAIAAARPLAAPLLGDGARDGERQLVRNPADHGDVVGDVIFATSEIADAALAQAADAEAGWATTPPHERAAILDRAADAMEAQTAELMGLVIREAGKSLPNAIAEVREAVDFLRYYAAQARGFSNDTHRPLGAVVCISPWNFPLAIFTGQVAAALAAGNPVLAKPAEETPLIAAAAVALLREAGAPSAVLQLLPGAGEVGARLVADIRTTAVMFTGSTEVARLIQKELAKRLGPDGRPVPLIAETGGQNALVVDSSALAEQVVGDVIASAFDSAGQRCSALRVLCLQDDVADRVLAMLKGAMAELSVGNPDRLATDVGPVISEDARGIISGHVERMRAAGRKVDAAALPEVCRNGTFVAPTLIEIDDLTELKREVFGPVLHVLRFKREKLDALIDAIDATGYGLTFGLHSRIDETIDRVLKRVGAGNVYVNRNVIGAVVGVQPFGGRGLSGTGPKAGGPLYLRRLLSEKPADAGLGARPAPVAAKAWADRLDALGRADLGEACREIAARSPFGLALTLQGPVGERNTYELHARGAVLCAGPSEDALAIQIGAALAAGNTGVVAPDAVSGPLLAGLSPTLAGAIAHGEVPVAVALCDAGAGALKTLQQTLAAREGAIVTVHVLGLKNAASFPLDGLVDERSVSVNTAAAGGNASLMALEG